VKLFGQKVSALCEGEYAYSKCLALAGFKGISRQHETSSFASLGMT